MSQNLDEMFQTRQYAPSFSFQNIGDTVHGDIVHVERQLQTEVDDRSKYVLGPDGQPKPQLQVILATQLRSWQGVSPASIPRDMDTRLPLGGDRDDGRRAVYVKGWMVGTVGDAVEKGTGARGAPREGGKLAVKFTGTRPSSKPQPIKLYEAWYQPPAPGADGMFQTSQPPQQQQSWGAPQQQQAPPPQQQQPDPWATGAPQSDPWAQTMNDEPPF